MKMWSYVNGGYRATQEAWSRTAYQLRRYAFSRLVDIPPSVSRQVQAFEEVVPADTGGNTKPVTAPASQPPSA